MSPWRHYIHSAGIHHASSMSSLSPYVCLFFLLYVQYTYRSIAAVAVFILCFVAVVKDEEEEEEEEKEEEEEEEEEEDSGDDDDDDDDNDDDDDDDDEKEELDQ